MITVQEAMTTGRLPEARLLAGESGLHNEISNVTIMDIPEIADWLTGGELVIAGVLFQQCFSMSLIQALKKKNVAGMVTKEKFTSSVDHALLSYCDAIGFPIILAPADCNWGQIMNPITTHIIEKPYLIIKAAQDFHNSMMKAMIDGISLSEMCNKSHESMSHSVAIMDNDHHLLGYGNDFDWKTYARAMNTQRMKHFNLTLEASDGSTEIHIFSCKVHPSGLAEKNLLFYPVIFNQIHYGYIAVATEDSDETLTAMENLKIQQFGMFFALYTTKQSEISNATRRFNGLIMDRILETQDLTRAQAEKMLAPMEKKIHRQYHAVQFLYEDLENLDSFVRRNSSISRFHEALAEKIPNSNHILLFEKTYSQILLIPSPTENFDQLILTLRALFLETTKMHHVFIGISELVTLQNIKTAFIQSEYAGNYLKSTNSHKACYYYADLGVLKYFLDNKGNLDEQFLRGIYDHYITPLRHYDNSRKTSLLETLELYIANNCNKTETEKQLFIHKNTLRARLSTINKLLDCDLSCMEDLFNVQLALKLMEFFEEN